MKTKFLVAVSFILALGMASCSDSLDGDNPAAGKGDNVLVVKLPDNIISTRAVEEQVSNLTDTGVDDVTVFLLIGQLVERAAEFDSNDLNKGYKRFEQVPAQVDRVIVVANKVGESILGLTNSTQIKNYAYTVASQHNKTELDGRTLMGEAIAVQKEDTSSEADGHIYKEASVSLEAITARIEVGAVTPGEGVETVELVAVYVNNFYGKYPQTDLTLYAEDNAIWSATVTGSTDPGANKGSKDPIGTITPGAYIPTQYMTLGSTDVTLTANSKVYAYHVFPENVPHVILLVKVELKENYFEVDGSDELKYKYGYITFSKFKTSSGDYVQAMKGHNVYKMGVGTKGIPVDAKDITDKPEKGPYDLSVDIEIAPWTIHEVTPEV